jgi:tRNA(Arg) A34 adenosine deaminase TadA
MYYPDIMESVIRTSEEACGGEVPVFAAIAVGDVVLGFSGNESEAFGKPWYHAEFLAIQQVYEKAPGIGYLSEASIYVNLEPCAFCAAALGRVRIKNIFFGAYDSKCGAITHGAMIFNHTLGKPNIIGGIQEERCSRVISRFFRRVRDNET